MSHFREECEHGTTGSQCRCMNRDKEIRRIPCPPRCKFYQQEEMRFVLVVTVVPKPGGRIRIYPDGDRYVQSPSGTDSLHPIDVMDVLRDELDSLDKPGRQSQIDDCLWEVKSVKLAPEEVSRALDEDDRTAPA